MHSSKLQELILECVVMCTDMHVLVIPLIGQVVGVTGTVFIEIAIPQGCIALLSIPHTPRLNHVGMVFMMRDRHCTLGELDLEALAHHALMAEGFVGTLLDPLRERGLLVQLSKGFIALMEGSLICCSS